MCNPEQFVKLFAEGWARGEPTLLKILHPEGQMRHPGMARPVAYADAPDYVRRIKSSLPDVRLEVRDWAARGNTVFIEWTMTATVRGTPVTWDGADRIILRDGLAIRRSSLLRHAPNRCRGRSRYPPTGPDGRS